MILQKLLLPDARSGADQAMYLRTDGCADERGVRLNRGQSLSLDTYFNVFSIEKWIKYTRLSNLRLRLSLTGRFRVRVFCKRLTADGVVSGLVDEREGLGDGRDAGRDAGGVEIGLPCAGSERGVYCCELEALEDGCVFTGGAYETDLPECELNPVSIAVDICTFRREAFVTRNIALLNDEIIQNPSSALYGCLELFISDNGQTLDASSLSGDRVHIFPNRNVGGAGGFTRGMLEILKRKEQRGFTHVLLMDDDVLIHPDALERTCRLLQMLKPGYLGKTIAGAMLRLDHRFIQHENGAFWNGRYTESAHSFLDMRRLECVLRGEDESADPVNFNAWWYSCIPIGKISPDNLPLPLFIRFDDVEYGLRTGSDVLSLGGICLWHEPFEQKYASSMDYYHMRNGLIINAFHRPDIGGVKAALEMIHMVLSSLVRYRYGSVALILRAANDFLKGADHMLSLDAEALHKELMAASQKFLPLDQLSVPFDPSVYAECYRRFDAPIERVLRGEPEIKAVRSRAPKEQFKRLIRWVTFNGLLLPAKGDYIVHPVMNHTSAFFRKRAVLNYDPVGRKGFVSERSVRRSFALLFKSAWTGVRLAVRHAAVCEDFRRRRADLTGVEFWTKYLGLSQEGGK